jgi:hypothetical protein
VARAADAAKGIAAPPLRDIPHGKVLSHRASDEGFTQLSAAVETTPAMTPATARLFGLHRSGRMVLRLSALFMIMTRGQGP